MVFQSHCWPPPHNKGSHRAGSDHGAKSEQVSLSDHSFDYLFRYRWLFASRGLPTGNSKTALPNYWRWRLIECFS